MEATEAGAGESVTYQCGICVEEFPEDGVVKYCDGKHVFCRGCFDRWKENRLIEMDQFGKFTNVTEHYCDKYDMYVGMIPDLICKDVRCPLCREKIVWLNQEEIASFSGTVSKSLTRTPFDDNESTIMLQQILSGYRVPKDTVTYTVECSYLNGKKHGLFKRVGYFLDTVEECRFENGLIQGNYMVTVNTTCDQSARGAAEAPRLTQVTIEAPYVDGKRHGVLRKWYFNENGSGEKRLRSHTNYKMGKREGEDRSYYEDGTNEYSAIAENDCNIHLTLWWRNGNLRAISDRTVKIPGSDHRIDTYRGWYKNGNPQEVMTMRYWRRYGIYQKYDLNGNLVLEHDYGEGDLDGPEEQLYIQSEIDGDDEQRALGSW